MQLINLITQKKDSKSFSAIVMATNLLLNGEYSSKPTAREISKTSGYASGLIYKHFESLELLIEYCYRSKFDDLFNSFVLQLKQKFDASEPKDLILESIKIIFDQVNEDHLLWKSLKVHQLRNNNLNNLFTKSSSSVSSFIIEINTLQLLIFEKKLQVKSNFEIEYCLRSSMGLLLMPFVDNSVLAGSDAHLFIFRRALSDLIT